MPQPTERILVFVPMYNCERQIGRVLARFGEEARSLVEEVMVVDNRSKDASVDRAVEALTRLPGIRGRVCVNDRNYNLGGSHKVAFNAAIDRGFDYLVVLHGDDQADINDLVPRLRAGEHRRHDSYLGSRFMRGSRRDGYSTFRTLGNRVFNFIFSLAALRPVHDLGSGLNVYKTSYLRSRFYVKFPDALTFNNFMLLAGAGKRSDFAFFPISWREEDQRSNVKMVRQALKTAWIPTSYRLGPRRFLAADYTAFPDKSYTTTTVAVVEGGRVVEDRRPGQSGARREEPTPRLQDAGPVRS